MDWDNAIIDLEHDLIKKGYTKDSVLEFIAAFLREILLGKNEMNESKLMKDILKKV